MSAGVSFEIPAVWVRTLLYSLRCVCCINTRQLAIFCLISCRLSYSMLYVFATLAPFMHAVVTLDILEVIPAMHKVTCMAILCMILWPIWVPCQSSRNDLEGAMSDVGKGTLLAWHKVSVVPILHCTYQSVNTLVQPQTQTRAKWADACNSRHLLHANASMPERHRIMVYMVSQLKKAQLWLIPLTVMRTALIQYCTKACTRIVS